jgi:bromodomain-containing protein 7/9
MLATAAKTFNPVGTVPHNAAIKIHAQGLRQIDRIRDLVITPPPSRAGSAPWRDGSVMSGRGMTAAPDGDHTPQKVEVPPLSYVPAEMLSYPPHSGPAKMVGWNLNGGKRVYLKKITRGREKFTGKWRHWDLDGSRDVAEMDEPDMLFAMEKTRTGTRQRSIVDWKQMRRETWWEYEGIGGPNGQPPLAGTPFPKRPIVRERPLTATDWGVYPDIDNEMTAAVARYGVYDETAALYSHLNASRLKPLPTVPHNFVNIFEDAQRRQPVDYLREVATGDITGEAYTRSVDRFIQGAIAGRKTQQKPTENSIELSEYVNEHFAHGVLSPDFEQRKVIRSTLTSLRHIAEASSSGSDKAQPPPQIIDSKKLMSLAQASYGRTALRHLTAHANSLDIVPLIRSPAEFTWQGIGAKGDIEIGLRWVSQRIKAASDLLLESRKRKRSASPSGPDAKRSRIEDIPSSPLTAVSSPIKDPQVPAAGIMSPTTFDSVLDPTDGEGGMKRVRLELLALTKFYPLAALRKMDKASAEQLLPTNVRALMTKPA